MQTNSVSQSRRLARLKPLAVALLSAGFVSHAVAAAGVPNLNCVAGTCNAISTEGTTTTMGQTSKIAVYETFDFSLARGNTLINKGTKGDLTLIRVTQNPDSFGSGARSFVDGSVYSEPTFVLVNPWGISVSGQIVSPFGSIVLSGKDLDVSLTEDGYAGLMKDGAHLVFNTNIGGGYGDPMVTINSGAKLEASADGGSIFLIGERVVNHGLITSGAGGQINLMAAGSTEVELGDSGFITLTNASAGPRDGNLYVGNDGTLSAAGGSVTLTAHGANSSVEHAGVIDVSNASGKGGAITLSAQHVYVGVGESSNTNAKLLANGSATSDSPIGGGVIEIDNATAAGLPQASSTITIDSTAELSANATDSGNGGLIRLSTFTGLDGGPKGSNQGTLNVFGKLSARGGANGGDGGTVQMEGTKVVIREEGSGAVSVDVSAGGPAGAGGLWSLYSPNITIGSQTLGPDFGSEGTYVNQTDINNVLNSGANVGLSTSYQNSPTVYGGDLIVEKDTQLVRTAGTGTNALILQSSNDIVVGSGTTIASSSGKMNVVLLADADRNGVGSVRLNGLRSVIRNVTRSLSRPLAAPGDEPITINSNGGDVVIAGGQGASSTLPSAPITDYAGVEMSGTVINTQGSDGSRGNITIKGMGGGADVEFTGNRGVDIDSSDLTGGFTSIIGFSAGSDGVYLSDTTISTANQLVSINGVSTAAGVDGAIGVNIGPGVVINMGQGGAKILGLAEGDGAIGVQIADLLLTTAPPSAGVTPTFTLVGESRGSSNPGIVAHGNAIRMQTQGSTVAASADVIVGGKADSELAPDALDLGSPQWNTTGRINFRPLALALEGDQLDRLGVSETPSTLATPIRVADGEGTPAANFLVRPAWFVGAGATADNPDVTTVVIGSSGHTGLISVDAGALERAGPVSLQNQGAGSQGIALAEQALPKQTVNLLTTGDITQTGPLSVDVLNVIAGPQSQVLLNNPANRINILASSGLSAGAAVSSVATPSAAGAQGIAGFSSLTNYFEQLDIRYDNMLPDIPRPFEGPDALSELRTDVYVKGQFGKAQICTPANTTGAATGGASSDIEPLSQEWTKVRRGAQLTNCSGVQADSNCSAF